MLAEVATYTAASEAAQEQYGTVQDQIDDLYRNGKIMYEECLSRREYANQDRQVAINTAWNELTKSSDPLVKFIAEECKNYQHYAIQILRMLPASAAEIERYAENESWCDIYTRFLGQARKAGVMPTLPSNSPREELTYWFQRTISGHQSYLRQLLEYVDAIVAAELEQSRIA